MRRKLGEILLSSGVVGPGDIADALSEQSAGEPARLGDLLVARGKLTPVQLAQALAEQYGVPFTSLPPLPTAVLDLVPLEFQRTHRLVPLRAEGTVLHVAMADLADREAVASLQQSWTQVVVHVAPGDEIDALHGTLSGVVPAPRASPSGPGKPLEEELFGALDALEAGPPPGVPTATASALFGDLNLDEAPAAAPATTPSQLFDLTASLPSSPSAPPLSPSGVFELTVEPPGPASPPPEEEAFELSTELSALPGEAETVVVTTELDVPLESRVPPPPPPSAPPPSTPAATTVDETDEEEALFYEAQLANPSPVPIAPPPVVAPVASLPVQPAPIDGPVGELSVEVSVTEESEAPALAEFLDGIPDGEPVPPLRDDTFAPKSSGPSVLEQLFIAPEEPLADLAPPPPVAPEPPPPPPVAPPPVSAAPPRATSTSGRLPAVKAPPPKASPARPDAAAPSKPAPPKADAPKPEARKADAPKPIPKSDAAASTKPAAPSAPKAKPAPKEELPDWLRDDSAPAPAATPGPGDPWTGELEVLAPSRLITGVARALIRKGVLTEQDVLEALEREKS